MFTRARYYVAVGLSGCRTAAAILRTYWKLGRLTSAEYASEVMDTAPDGGKLRSLEYEYARIRQLTEWVRTNGGRLLCPACREIQTSNRPACDSCGWSGR